MDLALRITAVALWLISVWGILRYNLHMFQLNGYKNKEHFNWLIKNIQNPLMLLLAIVPGALVLFLPKLVSIIGTYIVCIVYFVYYMHLKKINNKKKLVFTNRIKRLLITKAIINLSVVIVAYIVVGKFLYLTMGILIALQPWIVILANIINSPIEKSINNGFIKDAKRILASQPDLKIIGVTGSYGKTSVKYYLQTLLKSRYNVLVTPASFNTPMGVVRTIREELKPIHEIFVCEMGARNIGDIKELCDIVHPHYGMITSVGPQHLETFLNMENITNTKFELADAIPAEGLIFLNGDNDYIINNSDKYPNRIFYSTTPKDGVYYSENITVSQNGTEFDMVAPNGEKEHFKMKLVGGHNVINVAGAIAVANSLGIPFSELKNQVRKIMPVEHRMQLVEKGNVTIIDDAYNSNPVGSKAAVETLAMFAGTRILVTPGMVELGKEEERFNYEFGTYAAKCCDYIALVGKKHTEPIYKGVMESGFPADKCKVFDNLNQALEYAYSIPTFNRKFILLENDLPDNY